MGILYQRFLSVRTLKDQLRAHCGVVPGKPLPLEALELYQRLSRLGWEARTKEPEECFDVDSTAVLSLEEFRALQNEIRKIEVPQIEVPQKKEE